MDLYRAVEGRPAGPADFLECLLAEAAGAGLAIASGDGLHEMETSRSSWQGTDPMVGASSLATNTAASALVATDALCSGGGERSGGEDAYSRRESEGRTGEKRLRNLISFQDDLKRQLGEVVTKMADVSVWPLLGFRDLSDYAQRGLGWSRSTLYSRVQLVRRLRRLPLVRQAYQEGRIGISAAQMIAKILTGESASGAIPLRVPALVQQAWADRAAKATMKRMQDEAREVTRFMVFKRAVDEAASVKRSENLSGLNDDHPQPLDDRAWHASLHRQAGSARRRVQALSAMALASPGPLLPLRLVLPLSPPDGRAWGAGQGPGCSTAGTGMAPGPRRVRREVQE